MQFHEDSEAEAEDGVETHMGQLYGAYHTSQTIETAAFGRIATFCETSPSWSRISCLRCSLLNMTMLVECSFIIRRGGYSH